MGDRANIHIVEDNGGSLFFYTHWDGYKLPEILASALDRGRSRWNDEQYLSRIIFCRMIENDVRGETGYGISTYRGDDNYPDLVVDMENSTITDRDNQTLSFEDFISKYKGERDVL